MSDETRRQPMLDILLRDGADAFMDELYRQEMQERALNAMKRMEEHSDEIEAMLADDASDYYSDVEDDDLTK